MFQYPEIEMSSKLVNYYVEKEDETVNMLQQSTFLLVIEQKNSWYIWW